MNEICKNCRYFFPWTNQPNERAISGDCRIKPPEQFPQDDGKVKTKWPAVRETDFCGGFKEKKP